MRSTSYKSLLSTLVACLMMLCNSMIVHAVDNDGWFDVSSGSSQNANDSAVDRQGKSLMPKGSQGLHSLIPDSSWQAVPVTAQRVIVPVVPVVPVEPVEAVEATVGNRVTLNRPPPTTQSQIREFSDAKDPALLLTEEQLAIKRQQRRNALAASSVNTINVDMFAGEVKVLGQVKVTRVAVGNGDIIRAEVLKTGELLVIAQSEGSTSLRLWHSDKTQSDFNIRVSSSDPETRIRMETMVRMHVRMVEFRKSALGKLGIDWSDSTAGPGLAIAGDAVGNNLYRLPGEGFAAALPNTVKPFTTYFGVAASLTSRINFMASTGDATTLAEPVLSTTSGGTASFLAGGEVPYPSVGANGQTVVQFKEYGIKLHVSPSIDALGNVRTVVETEISQLDPAVSVQGTPGLLTRRAQTQVNVRSGETIVISGLLSSESSKHIDKLPGIGNLPIIGNFFRSQNARNAVSELVIFVTPEIVEPSGTLMSAREQNILDNSEVRIGDARQQIRLLD